MPIVYGKQLTVDNVNILERQLHETPNELPFEIAPLIHGYRCDWYEANKHCEALGDGWRLPTLEELKLIYEYDNTFCKGWCWSSSNGEEEDDMWVQNMYNGRRGQDITWHARNMVIAIRDI